MAIASAVERGSQVFAYNERGLMLFTKANGSGPHDGLLGFTSSSVTVRSGSVIITYGENGQIIYTKGA